jgi:hypothetical protein
MTPFRLCRRRLSSSGRDRQLLCRCCCRENQVLYRSVRAASASSCNPATCSLFYWLPIGAPILGTNHHRQTIIFGVDLLFDESDESFFWLFSNFLKAMSGKHPETIFTDQCAAMAKAIEIALPNSCHRFAYGTYTKML